MDLLVRLNGSEQQTFVLVTHDAAVAARAHRTIRMRDGRITSDEQNPEEA
jgi:macrolide transport system ATP-binding/permease protein